MKKLISIISITLFLIVLLNKNIHAQGCVAIRSTGGSCLMQHPESSKWAFNINNRYFKSYKHYVGTGRTKVSH